MDYDSCLHVVNSMTEIALDGAVEIVRKRAQDYFEGATPAHDWHHVQRVEQLAETLSTERDDANQQILRLAVLLHDIGRMREDQGMIDDHAVWGANEAESILSDITRYRFSGQFWLEY